MATEDLTENALAYLDWRVDPERKGSKTSWAQEHHTTLRQVRAWEAQNLWREAFEQRCRDLNVSFDRVQDVINAMHQKAINGDVQAAKIYMGYVERINPSKPVEAKGIEDLSDEELDELGEKTAADAQAAE